jgi:cell wall-associated NlpC family hydrolase
MAIPASTVLLVATGGVLIYAGFANQNPLTALREVASGKPTPVRNDSSADLASYSSGSLGSKGGIANIDFADVATGEGIPSLPRAAERFAGDKYSQAKRWSTGYSDCSSFVGKSLKVIGIKPPTGSTTFSYLSSKEWKRVRADDVLPGDLACAANHVVICYGNGMGIGQQNKRSNVQRGSLEDLMYGNTPYVFLRYTPAGSTGSTDKPSSTGKPKTVTI